MKIKQQSEADNQENCSERLSDSSSERKEDETAANGSEQAKGAEGSEGGYPPGDPTDALPLAYACFQFRRAQKGDSGEHNGYKGDKNQELANRTNHGQHWGLELPG